MCQQVPPDGPQPHAGEGRVLFPGDVYPYMFYKGCPKAGMEYPLVKTPEGWKDPKWQVIDWESTDISQIVPPQDTPKAAPEQPPPQDLSGPAIVAIAAIGSLAMAAMAAANRCDCLINLD